MRRRPPSSQETIEDRKNDRRIQIENDVAVEGVRLEQVETGRVLEAVDEFAVRQLVDADQFDFDDRPHQPRQIGAEFPAEAFVHRLKCPHLLYADALGTFEFVHADLRKPAVSLRVSSCCDCPPAVGSSAASSDSTSD